MYHLGFHETIIQETMGKSEYVEKSELSKCHVDKPVNGAGKDTKRRVNK